MTLNDTPLTERVAPRLSISKPANLRGTWLWLARAVWLLFFTATVGLIAAGFIENPSFLVRTRVVLEVSAACKGLGFPTDVCALSYIILKHGMISILYFAIAILIFSRRSNEGVALLTSLSLIALPTYGLGSLQLILLVVDAWWLGGLFLIGNIGILCFVWLLYLFPDGRFVPGWSVWLAVIAALVVGVLQAAGFGVYAATMAAFIFTGVSPIATLALTVLGLSGIVGVVGQLVRYRRLSTPQQRQQSKWMVLGLIAIVLWLVVEQALMPRLGLVSLRPQIRFILALAGWALVAPLLLLAAPLCVMFAITRYRLWDIDFIINRTLVYGGLTVILLAVFAGLFFAAQAVLGAVLGGGQDILAAVVPAIAVTALFNPARKRLRAFVDERLYGIKIDYSRPNTPAPSPIAVSHTLHTRDGLYANLEPIGRGGMGEIYKAVHPTLGKPVAIKVLPAHLVKEADFRKRFEREARTVRSLAHPNIVQMLDFGESDGTHYMIMEYIAGHDLSETIRQSAPMPLDRVMPVLTDVASALDYAHAQGLVHRDIKPSNVMIEQGDSRAILMDFGIARIVGKHTRLTATGMLGTFDYMSPEQINNARDVDGRADVYALGVMAYQMLTGKLPFTAGSAGALLMLHLRQPPPDPRDIATDLPENAAMAVMQAMSKDPQERYASAGAMTAAMAT